MAGGFEDGADRAAGGLEGVFVGDDGGGFAGAELLAEDIAGGLEGADSQLEAAGFAGGGEGGLDEVTGGGGVGHFGGPFQTYCGFGRASLRDSRYARRLEFVALAAYRRKHW
jgi:hypothetical protein